MRRRPFTTRRLARSSLSPEISLSSHRNAEFGVQRVGHGCSAIRDKDLLRRLARDQILVEVCQTSNYLLAAVKPGERHPVYTFLEHGVLVAI